MTFQYLNDFVLLFLNWLKFSSISKMLFRLISEVIDGARMSRDVVLSNKSSRTRVFKKRKIVNYI